MMRIHFNKDMDRCKSIPIFATIAVTCLLLLLSTTAAQAQTDADGNIDGSWSYPRNDLGQTPVTCQDINNSPDDPTNENVVRYGQPIGAADCGELSFRSGFGFNGANTVTFAPGTPFLLGQFTHYNWNIETALVPMQFVDLTIDLQSANPPLTAQFSYTMQLDETLNFGSCPYGSTNQELCDDRVDFVNNTPPQTIVVDGVTYTLNILGFVPIEEGEACTYRSDLVDYFITGELMRNDACIFAEFVIPEPAIAIEKSPDWQSIPIDDTADFTITVTNTGNIGFDAATILDPLTPDCERTITGLKSGATETFICTAYGVVQDFENIATVIAVYDGVEYSDVDTARVDVMAPDTATLHAIKYHDLNSNGQRDAGEPGLYGWTLCVRDGEGETVGFCQVTDPDGRATLAPNRAGDFLLCETPQPGWTNTDPGDGSACKPFSITAAPLYAEFFPTANDMYGVELLEKSADELRWTYAVYQFLASQNLQAWTLALPPCIGAAQIDANATTPGWNIIEDTVNGLRGIQWQTPGGVDPTWGSPFTLAFVQPYATGASAAGIVTGADASVGDVRAVSGPICSEPVLIGNASAASATGQLEVRKAVMPANDSGFFNLAIDSVILATNVQNGGTTGKQTVAAGVHVVGEGGGASTDLDDYERALSCTEMNSGRTWTPAVTGEVIVGIGEDVVCTFTNIRRGAIRIVKQVDGPATADWQFDSAALGAFTLPAAGGEV
ncbi:MAG: choice-of-anchor K domain-containing protein, partial [Caldilinea sp.]